MTATTGFHQGHPHVHLSSAAPVQGMHTDELHVGDGGLVERTIGSNDILMVTRQQAPVICGV